jgi:hypothetical protein
MILDLEKSILNRADALPLEGRKSAKRHSEFRRKRITICFSYEKVTKSPRGLPVSSATDLSSQRGHSRSLYLRCLARVVDFPVQAIGEI